MEHTTRNYSLHDKQAMGLPACLAQIPCCQYVTCLLCTHRLTEPITDRETLAVAEHFETHGLLEHVARARKRALGSHFPRAELG